MNEQEVKALETAIASVNDTISNLQRQLNETQVEIGRLQSVKGRLMGMLPTNNRFDLLLNKYRQDPPE